MTIIYCVILFILQCISISNIIVYLNNVLADLCYCVLLDCESFIPVNFIPLFFIHVWHPRFPFKGIKNSVLDCSSNTLGFLFCLFCSLLLAGNKTYGT